MFAYIIWVYFERYKILWNKFQSKYISNAKPGDTLVNGVYNYPPVKYIYKKTNGEWTNSAGARIKTQTFSNSEKIQGTTTGSKNRIG